MPGSLHKEYNVYVVNVFTYWHCFAFTIYTIKVTVWVFEISLIQSFRALLQKMYYKNIINRGFWVKRGLKMQTSQEEKTSQSSYISWISLPSTFVWTSIIVVMMVKITMLEIKFEVIKFIAGDDI